MARPCKLTTDIQQKIGDGISLGLTYALAANSAGVTYQSFNSWLKRGQTEKYGKYFEFYKYIQKRNADAARALLERLNEAAEAGNTQICMWILSRRFPDEFGRRVYRKTNVISESINENVELTIKERDLIRKQILEKFDQS
jgi:abortive infection bacteriophage resistance protein